MEPSNKRHMTAPATHDHPYLNQPYHSADSVSSVRISHLPVSNYLQGIVYSVSEASYVSAFIALVPPMIRVRYLLTVNGWLQLTPPLFFPATPSNAYRVTARETSGSTVLPSPVYRSNLRLRQKSSRETRSAGQGPTAAAFITLFFRAKIGQMMD